MELTMTNNFGFCELNENEMMTVDGGGFWGAIAAGLMKVGAAVGSAVGIGAIGGIILVGVCVVAVGVAIYAGCNS